MPIKTRARPQIAPATATNAAETMTEGEEYWCAIDIEKSRPELGRGVFAVGIVLAKPDGTILSERCLSSPVDIESEQFDESTRSFWRQFPDVLTRINANALVHRLTIEAVWRHLQSLDHTYGPFRLSGCKFRWICDNPAYDIGQLNLMFFMTGANTALADMFGVYTPTSDPTEQYKTLLDSEKAWVDTQLKTQHTHYPADDAKRDIEMMVAIRRVLEQRKQAAEAPLAPAKRPREPEK